MRDDYGLIELAKQGDNDAFAELVERYRRMLYAAAYSVLRSRDDAEDAAQEAICRIYVSLRAFHETGSFGRWAYTIARNAAIARLRSISREVPLDEKQEAAADGEPVAAGEVREAVDQLPERLREPLLMYYIDGYTGREIADVLGLPAGTVRSQLTEARKLLRKELLPMLKRTIEDLVPGAQMNELLARLQALPKTQPELSIVEVDAPTPDPDYLEDHWFFTPLKPGGTAIAAWYDYPERQLTDFSFGRVLGKAEIAGWDCYEIIRAGSPYDQPDCYGLSYWSVTEDALHWIARYSSEEDRLRLRTDPDWNDTTAPWLRYPARSPRLRRVAEEEFVDEEPRQLAPVGTYDVTVSGKTDRCLRVISQPPGGVLVEAYANADGRTVLFRRYNAAPEWSRENVRGPYQTPGAVERLMELGNHRLVFNGREFCHWYDCMTDVVLGV